MNKFITLAIILLLPAAAFCQERRYSRIPKSPFLDELRESTSDDHEGEALRADIERLQEDLRVQISEHESRFDRELAKSSANIRRIENEVKTNREADAHFEYLSLIHI